MKIFRSRFMLLVLAILALRFILMIALPLADSTEGRYAMIGARMLTESDWVTPRVWFKGEDLPFLGKPPLHFWGEAVAMQLIGLNELAARLPAFVAGAVLLGLMFTVLKRYRDRRLAQQAVLMTATTVMFFILSGAVAVDLTLATFSTGGILAYMGFLAAEEPRVRRRFSLLVFACLGLGFMTKGPIALLMFGLPVFAWTLINRQWQTLRGHAWGLGITLFLLITVPWFAVCEARNPGFLRYFFIHENLLRYITPEYGDRYGGGHAYPYGSALVMMLVGALPWSLAVFALLTKRGRRALISRDALVSPIEGMALTGALLIPLFWCFAKQLLATYMMPAVPLYCLWLAHSTSRAKTVSPVVYRTATAMLLVFVVGGVLAAYKLGQDKSTRQILNRLASQPGVTVNDPIVFVHSVPNSAYFYRPDAVVPHPKEPSETSLKRALSTPRGAMICARRHYQELAPAVRAGLTVVDQAGKWYIVKVAATELVPVKDTP